MRRSRRYRDKPVLYAEIETDSLAPDFRPEIFGSVSYRTVVTLAEAQRRAAKHGWINWHINRGRLPLSPDDDELALYKRQRSWRRLH